MTITWPELVVLMAYGDGTTDRLSGILREREVWQLDDSDDADEDEVVEEHPTLGRVVVREHEIRIQRSGDLVRVARPSGEVTAIFGAETTWLFATEPPTAYPANRVSLGWAGAEFVRRLPASRWEGDDFTRVSGPITAVEFLGRPAWLFELAPPPRKPYPMQLTVDAATGVVLRQANRDFGSYHEWVSLEIGADLPAELFVWTGKSQPPRDHDAEHEADLAGRRAWLAERGMAQLPVFVPPVVTLHEWSDETGAFLLSFHSVAGGTLVRRPHSDAPWDDADHVRYPNSYRWADENWDWLLGSETALDEAQLAELRDRLAKTT